MANDKDIYQDAEQTAKITRQSEDSTTAEFLSIERQPNWWKRIAIACLVLTIAVFLASVNPFSSESDGESSEKRTIENVGMFIFAPQERYLYPYDVLADKDIAQDYAYLLYEKHYPEEKTVQISSISLDAEQGVWKVMFEVPPDNPYRSPTALGGGHRFIMFLSKKTGELIGTDLIVHE